jgi:hypothetical protein
MNNVVEKVNEILDIYKGYAPTDVLEHIESVLDPNRGDHFIAINSFKGCVLFTIGGDLIHQIGLRKSIKN